MRKILITLLVLLVALVIWITTTTSTPTLATPPSTISNRMLKEEKQMSRGTIPVVEISPIVPLKSVDYKTFFDCNQAVVEETDTELKFAVRNAETREFLFFADRTIKYVKANHTVNIRTTPSTNAESVGKLDTQKCVLEIAKSDRGWSIVMLDATCYYVWSEYLDYLDERPEDLIQTVEGLDTRTFLGYCRISSYCYKCNSPKYSYKSSVPGWECQEWQTCAANGIPIGTRLYVEGYGEFIVNDRGPKAMNGGQWIDLFVDCDSCHIWAKRNVWIIE